MKTHTVTGVHLIQALTAARAPKAQPSRAVVFWSKFQAWVDWAFETEGHHLPKPFIEPSLTKTGESHD